MKGFVLTSRYAVGMTVQYAILFALIPLYTLRLSTAEFGAWAVLLITVTLIVQAVLNPVSNGLERFFYHPNYRDAPDHGGVWEGGDCTYRMVRGGAFNSPPPSIRSAKRAKRKSDRGYDTVGMRLVRER